MSHLDIKQYLKNGAINDILDYRDINIEDVFAASEECKVPLNYSVEDNIGKLKIESQNGSQSCVAQAVSKYDEVLQRFDMPTFQKDSSAKWVYSRIYIPEGGASIRDAFKIWNNIGICEEEFDKSYPAEEDYMRQVNENFYAYNNAKDYKISGYASIPHYGDGEIMKKAIFLNKGVVTGFKMTNNGWKDNDIPFVYPPTNEGTIYGHCVYIGGYITILKEDIEKIESGKKKIDDCLVQSKTDKETVVLMKMLNSWSAYWKQNGWCYIHPSYWKSSNNYFSLWSAIDIPNNLNTSINMKRIIKSKTESEYYVLENNNKYHIPDWETYLWGIEMKIWGQVEEVNNIDTYPNSEDWPSIKKSKSYDEIKKICNNK